ncbi:DgyrCDS7053 [Dimorphilus gyrociliatus]|uniref:DgyrCDS7053 n=1 Tax=Dimorphilus gyrociliatus TaxID=2664684 RepID=A0A7I8VPX8_9ANNE|nr:DgyrCDS7053 [Dimorphilus gyrociliatus]
MGISLFSNPSPFRHQVYEDLKGAGKITGHLFEDPEFPADSKSLGIPNEDNVIWRRPPEFCDDPRFIMEGDDFNDAVQGKFGNSWFVGAITCLTGERRIWSSVVPDPKDQEWDKDKPMNYVGIFHFRFWRFGEWKDVVVDDRLPTIDGQLIFTYSCKENEFWIPLIEKAYAKLCGSYGSLDKGELGEALVDFTGGITETINMKDDGYKNSVIKQSVLFEDMRIAFNNKSLMAAAIPVKALEEDNEDAKAIGLVIGQAYSITDVRKISFEGRGYFQFLNSDDKLQMVRLRNPWGANKWKGTFSDDSEEWKRMDQSWVRKNIRREESKKDFWMTFEDFCKHFVNLAVCRIINTNILSLQKRWLQYNLHSEWSRKNNRAGGCANNPQTFLKNPQFLISVNRAEEEVMVYLTQKSRIGYEEMKNETIGFTIIKVEDNRPFRIHDLSQQEVIKSSVFRNSRSIFMRHILVKGRYIIVPCTFEPHVDGNFLLRIYSGSELRAIELTEDKPSKNVCNCLCGCFHFCKYPIMATQVAVLKAVELDIPEKMGEKKTTEPYVVIKCEGRKVVTLPCRNSLYPEWGTKAIFYRRSPINQPITFEVWNSNLIIDRFLGQAVFALTEDMDRKEFELFLSNHKKENDSLQGKIYIKATNVRHLAHI